MNKKSRNYHQLQKISTATLLEESGHLKLILKAVSTLVILLIVFIIWAAFTKIKETAVTYGEVVPKGQVQVIQHLEGGIITKVLVSNGERVKKGQLLIQFKPEATQAELDQLRGREISLILDTERLRAYIDGKSADIVKWSQAVINSKYNTVGHKAEIQKILGDEKILLNSMNTKRFDQENVLKVMIDRRKEELREAKQQRAVWKRHLDLLNKEFAMYEKLKKRNLIAHKDFLIVLRDLNKANGEYVRLGSDITQAAQDILEAENKLKELDSSLREKALTELGTISETLLETRHKIEKLEERLGRTNIKATVNGVVKGLAVFAGNVVQPGGLLLEIVPEGREFVVESRVNPRDIGHIKVGDPVVVKILTYDYARYGSLTGKLTSISASTFNDDDGKPYYKATIALDNQYLDSRKGKKQLKAGMTVEASIVTGEKTLLQYILKPIHTTAGKAFRER